MFCTNCGNKLLPNAKFCTKCGKQVIVNQSVDSYSQNIQENDYQFVDIPQESIEEINEKKKVKNLCIWSLLFGFLFPRCMFLVPDSTPGEIISTISGLCSLAGLVLMVVARIKYPNSKFAKVVMWIYILSFILYVIFMIFIIVLCYETLRSCGNMG